MTAKRFIINKNMSLDSKIETHELSCLVDNENKTFYFIVDSIANVELFVERLNKLHSRNKRLEEKIQRERISFMKTHERWSKEAENKIKELSKENERLKSQLYCDEEGGVCNICKHHYLVKDDETEFGYNSRCKKGHYECARVSLKYCKDFEKELKK